MEQKIVTRYLIVTGVICVVLLSILAGKAWAATTTVAGFQGESMRLPSGSGRAFADPRSSGRKALLIWSDATATKGFKTSRPAEQLYLRVKGDQCNGSPLMTVSLDGRKVLQKWVWQREWTSYSAAVRVPAGAHRIGVRMSRDYRTPGCDRNLRLDSVRLALQSESTASRGNPFYGSKLYIDPNSSAKKQVERWRASRPADAKQMEKVASNSHADWFGDWSGDIKSAVGARVTQIRRAGALPVLVAYDIPIRDCGSYSSGGASSADAYRRWIRDFAAGIGDRKAVVVLEPDALSLMDCLSTTQKQERLALIKDVVNALGSHPRVSVYIDAGHSGWIPPAEMAGRLKNAGVTKARGFSLNVSNFGRTSSNVAYGRDISSRIGGKHFVIDTSRNGNGSNGEWCNPDGRALGERPSAAAGRSELDAYFWIKPPGESDGTCNGGPSAGSWWADYALGLARRAAY